MQTLGKHATALVGLLFLSGTALATTRTVTTTADAVAGSLRQAILDSGNVDSIDFDASLADKTITLTAGELLIAHGITISTNLRVSVSGGNASRVFRVAAGNTVSLAGLTIRDGATDGSGGAIQN